MFDKKVYDPIFTKSIKVLAASEKITKSTLLDLSRSVLEALHTTEDISYVNRMLAVLTPMNKQTTVLYFKDFSGFFFSVEEGVFTKKDKKTYDDVAIKSAEFLEDPLNNIWSWAARNVEIQKKEFKLDAITTFMTSAMKKANDNGFNQTDVLKAVLKAGIDTDALLAVMKELANNENAI